MDCNPNGMPLLPDGQPPILYALVIYLPEPLGSFLDHLRLELVPNCKPHAHVSVLPPRSLSVPPEAAIDEAQRVLAGFPPFEIELGSIQIFPVTNVIYISLKRGAEHLMQMHRKLNEGALAFDEPFAYHPHVTVGQEIEPQKVQIVFDTAREHWLDYRGPRVFRAERATFVQNQDGRKWMDLAECSLQAVPVG